MNRFRVSAMPTASKRLIHSKRRTADCSSDSGTPDAGITKPQRSAT
jgi:hypothetical protein